MGTKGHLFLFAQFLCVCLLVIFIQNHQILNKDNFVKMQGTKYADKISDIHINKGLIVIDLKSKKPPIFFTSDLFSIVPDKKVDGNMVLEDVTMGDSLFKDQCADTITFYNTLKRLDEKHWDSLKIVIDFKQLEKVWLK